MGHSETLRGSAVTSTNRAKTGTITIPEGMGGTLVAIDVISYGTLETGVLGAGGLVELVNGSVDWVPFEFYMDMPHELTSTSGGFMFQKIMRLKCCLPLPESSIVTVYFTPYDDQSQALEITIHWISGGGGRQTHMITGKGSAITQTTKKADHVSIDIPSGKGGRLLEVRALGLATSPIVVGTDPNYMGGTVHLKNKSARPSYEPSEFGTGAPSGLVAGAYLAEHTIHPCDLDLPGKSTLKADYTPANDASQYLMLTLKWER